ncbi:hypothetical protein FM102_04245 [Corynebacterium glutamicum]|nr:hypothetical protein FM102_04245 [Corynebacterium glutamicum]
MLLLSATAPLPKDRLDPKENVEKQFAFRRPTPRVLACQ